MAENINLVIGIDPGQSGFVVGIDKAFFNIAFALPLPFIGNQLITRDLDSILFGKNIEHIFIEHSQAIFGARANSTFNFGFNFGKIIAVCEYRKYAFTLVKPKLWQKEMITGVDKRLTTKEKSLIVASRLYPHISFKYPDSEKMADGMSDACLIACYGRKKLLNENL
jgi:hypothetical protein